jgi:hypothetical protein
MLSAARRHFVHDAGRVLHVEQGRAPHLPESIARVRVVGEFDRARPALRDRVLDLRADLRIGQVGKERERTLRESHSEVLYAGVGVGVKSGVSVDA